MRRRLRLIGVVVFLAAAASGIYWLTQDQQKSAEAPGTSSAAETASPGKPGADRHANMGGSPDSPSAAPAAATAESATDGQIVVLVKARAKPVPNAEIRLYWRRGGSQDASGWSDAKAGRTGEDGSLRLPARPGSYLVAARAEGFAAGRAEAIHPSGGAETRIPVELAPAVTLTGTTLDRKTRAPVALAEIVLSPQLRPFSRDRTEMPEAERVSVASDTRGKFTVTGLCAGRWMLGARAPSYSPAIVRNLNVPAADLVVEMESAGTIEGTVTREGKPVPGAAVTVTGAGEPVSVDTGPAGGYSAPVQPGTHHVTARAGDETGAAAAPVVIAAGATARGIDVELGPSATIAGRVRSSSGPVVGAALDASPSRESGSTSTAVTADDGAYELKGLAAGSYDVAVNAAGHGRSVSRGVTVRRGERFPLDIFLPDLTAIEGTVTLASGGPASGAIVSVAEGGGGGGPRGGGGGRGGGGFGGFGRAPPSEAITDSTGRYHVDGVSPGRAVVSARRDEGSPAATRMVPVNEGETAHADLVLVEGGLVAGTVVDAQGKPVPGAVVIAMDPSGGGGFGGGGFGGGGGGRNNTTADAGGAFLMPLSAGTWGLSAMRQPTGANPNIVMAGRPQVLATATVEIGHSAQVVLTLPAETGPNATGHVLEPGGTPSPGAMVRVSASDAQTQAIAADGSGGFPLRISPDVPTDVTARNGGRMGTVTAAAGAGDVTVQLKPAASISGKLVGDPVPDSFTVSLNTQGAPMWSPGGPGEQQFSASPFQMSDVAPGHVLVSVKTSDGRIGNAQADVAAGETANVEVTLSPAATLTGRVVDASTSKPLPGARTLVDGQPGRRGMTGSDGRFSRTVSVGQHQLEVSARGYQSATVPANATASPSTTDLGDIPLTPVGAPSGTIGATFAGTRIVSVASVQPNGPAALAGLMAGDEVEAIDGARPASAADADARAKGAPGAPIVLVLRRAGSPLTLTFNRAP